MAVKKEAQLVLSLFDRVTGPAKPIAATLERLNAAAKRNAAALDAMRGQMLDAVGAGYALYRGLSAPMQAAIDFESAMADIRKVVDFDSPDAFKKMGADIREMSLRIPMAADAIAEIVAAAGQSGIANSELTKFAEIAAKVGVAWDMSAGETGEALAKLKTALGRSVEDTASLADAINHLGNNSASSAPQILDVVKRVAPMASQFGMTAEQVAAIGAAMTGAGFESEVAATSLLNVGRALTKGASATPRVRAAFQKLGLSATGVAKAMQKDAVGTLQKVLGQINKLPAETRAAAISDLFGDEARALGPLISNSKLLADSLGLVADKGNYAGSAQAEFNNASQRTANSVQLFRNRVSDLGISIGDALLPALNQTIGILGPMVTSISEMAQRFPQVTAAVTGAVTALIAFRIATTAARFAGLYAVGGLINMAASFVSLSGVAGTLAGVLAGVSAPVWLAIGAAVAVVAGAGLALWRNWDRITSVLAGVGRAIGEELQPAISLLSPVLDPLAAGLRAIGDAGAWVGEKLSGLGEWLGSLLERDVLGYHHQQAIEANAYNTTRRIIDAFKSGNARLFEIGSEMISKLWDGIRQKFDELLVWFQDIPSRIKAAIGNIDLGGIIKWPSMPSWPGSSTPESAKLDGARARGGPVRSGGSYLVGEEGPEIFSPGRSGIISPNEAYRSVAKTGSATAAAGAQARSVVNHFTITLHANGVNNPEVLCDQVAKAMSERFRQEQSGIYADLGYSVA